MSIGLLSKIDSVRRGLSRPLPILGVLLIAGTVPCLELSAEGRPAVDGFTVGWGRAPGVNAPSQEVQVRVVRGGGTSAVSSEPPSRVGASPAGSEQALNQPECTICLTGASTVQWNGSQGSFQVDHVVNNRTSATGSLRLNIILVSDLPVWGDAMSYYDFSDWTYLSPLSAGFQYNNVTSGTIAFYPSSIPAGTYWALLKLSNYTGSWGYTDWITYNGRVSCNGASCSVLPSCVEDSSTMCLVGGRYRVTSYWKNQYAGGAISTLHKTTLTGATGSFWLSDSNAFEYFVRINTATDNGRAWITISTFTDVEFFVTVEDLVNGQSKTYHNSAYSSALIYDPFTFVYP